MRGESGKNGGYKKAAVLSPQLNDVLLSVFSR
jgi:hypothetical protein